MNMAHKTICHFTDIMTKKFLWGKKEVVGS